MKGNLIVVNKRDDVLDFYLTNITGNYYMFSRKYSRGVYLYFLKGKTESEIRQFHNWKKNKGLSKIIERIPSYIRYIEKEVMAA